MKKTIFVIALVLGILPFFAWGDCVCCGGEPLESGGICVKYFGSDTCQYREAEVEIEEGKDPNYTLCDTSPGTINSGNCTCPTERCGTSETQIGNACCGNEEVSSCQNSGGTMTSAGTICICSCPTGKSADDSSTCVCDNDIQQTYCENANPSTGYVTGSWNDNTCTCTCPGNSSFSNLAGCYCPSPYVVQNGSCIACDTNEVSCGTNGCVDMGNCSGSRDGLNGNYNTYGGVPSSDCSGYQLCSVTRECSPVTATNVYYGECFCSEAYLKTKCTSAQTYDPGTCTCINCSGTVVDNHCCTNEIPVNAHATYTGGSCGWECNTNYTQVSGQNICCDISSLPANAHATYTNGSCGWECDSDYTKVNNSICCLTSSYNTCTNSGGTLENSCSCSCPTPPAHAHYTALSSGSCNWECNSGYVKNEAGTACVCSNNSQKTYCETITPAVGYITGTWDDNTCTCTCPENSTSSESGCACSGTLPAHASYVSGSCDWTCDNEYTGVNNVCCLTSIYTTCTNSGGTLDNNCSCTCSGTLPAHASYVSGSCDWTCNGDYIKNTDGTSCVCPDGKESSGDDTCVCSNPERKTYCTNPTPGAGYVTGTWDDNTCTCTCPENSASSESGCACSGTLPAHASYVSGSCDWTCDSGYSQPTNQEICCDTTGLPEHAHIIYTNNACDWECESDYIKEGSTCVCNKTCENGMLDAKTCSCVCTEITCDGPHQELSYENESCGCHCQEDFDEVESNICCPTCATDDQMAAYRENQCTCICKNADQTLVGNKCCETCLTPKETTTDESGACACDCPLGTDNTNRLLYNEANNTCVECQENAEGDYRHYHWGSVPCCPVLATNNTTAPSSVATVSPQASSQTTTTSPITAPVLNSLSAILQKFSALTDEVPAPVATQTTSTPSSASSGSESFTNLQNDLQIEKESKIESESQKEETSQGKPPYDENGSVLLKLKDIQIVSMGNAPSFCSGNLEIQNKMKGTLSTLVLNLKYDSTTIPLSFSSVEDDQILTKKLSLVGPSCRQFSSTPQVVIVKCVIKGAESDTSACRGRIKFLITD